MKMSQAEEVKLGGDVWGSRTRPVCESRTAGWKHRCAQERKDTVGSRALMAQVERRVGSGWNENQPGHFGEMRQKEDASFKKTPCPCRLLLVGWGSPLQTAPGLVS